MRKLKLVAGMSALLMLFSFSSCSLLPFVGGDDKSQSAGFEMTSLDSISDRMFETILDAIENKDSDAVKAMFSQGALSEAKNLDAAVEYLFILFDGEVVSWERDTLSAGEERERDGTYSRLIRSWYTVHTEKTRYRFILLNYDKNTTNPDLQGLYTLRGINAEYAETQWGNWVEMEIPGVYMPEE